MGASTLSSKFWLRELPDSRGVRPTHINTLQSNVIDTEELHRDRTVLVGGQPGCRGEANNANGVLCCLPTLCL